MITLNIALAVGPALVLLVWAYRRDQQKPEPRYLVIRAFLMGFAAVIAAVAIGFLLTPLADRLRGVPQIAFEAYITAGLLEESAKLVVVLLFLARRPEFDEVTDGLVYTMAASLGFAVLENALYLGGAPSVLLLRGFTAVPLHAGAGAIIGYFVGTSRIMNRGSTLTGLFLAVLLHGTYDFFLFWGGLLSFATIPLLLATTALVIALFKRANNHDASAVGSRRPSA